MSKLVPVFLFAARLASAITISFTDVDVSFTGTELSVSNTASTVTSCDFPVGTCPNGNLAITGLILDGPLMSIGDHHSQLFMEGLVTFAVDGEDSLTAKILDASLTKSADETFFAFAEILSPLWANRFATSFLGISIPLAGVLQVSNQSLDAFRTTTDLHANPMYEDPGGHLPEPGTFALTGVLLSACIAGRRYTSRRSA